jgi:site-specific DNA-adenine methylase
VFFHLSAAGRIDQAHLSDSNPDLIAMSRAIRDETEAVIRHLAKLKALHDEEHFYAVP